MGWPETQNPQKQLTIMKRIFLVLAAGVVATLMTSCFNETESGLPPSNGTVAEVLVIMPDRQWETSVGAAVKSMLLAEQEGLNQAEPLFEPMQIQHQDFKGVFERNRKIIRVFVSDTVKKNQLVARRDVFSSPQLIIDLHAKSDSEAILLINERAGSIIEMLHDVERERLILAFRSNENKPLCDKMEKQFGFRIVIPESYYEAKTGDGFAWYRLEAPKYSQAILIYTREFTDSSQFSPFQIVAYRNAIVKQYIPGEMPGSYMSTDTIAPPVMRNVPFADTRAIEARGLWKTVGDFMGGPFLSYTFHDKKTNKVITLEGYVYYPSMDKRDLLMQLEAVLHSYEVKTK